MCCKDRLFLHFSKSCHVVFGDFFVADGSNMLVLQHFRLFVATFLAFFFIFAPRRILFLDDMMRSWRSCFAAFVVAWYSLAGLPDCLADAATAGGSAVAGTFAERVYDVLNMQCGLSESRVRCLGELPDGRLAVGTAGSVDIYDGTRFQSVPISPGLAYRLPGYRAYRRLACDVEGRVWLRNTGTLCVIHPAPPSAASRAYVQGRVDSVLSAIGWQGDSVTSFFLTNRGDSVTSYWLTDARGNFFLLEHGVQRLVCNLQATGMGIPEEVFVLDDRLFLGYHTGRICEIRLQLSGSRADGAPVGTLVFSSSDMQSSPPEGIRQGISMLRLGDQLWMTLNLTDDRHGFVKRLDLKSHEWLPHVILPMRISSLAMSPDSTICFVGTGGMYVLSADGLQLSHISPLTVNMPNNPGMSLLHDDLSSICFDRFGNVWIGAVENGLLHWHPSRRDLIRLELTPYPWLPAKQFPSERTRQLAERLAPDATNCSAETPDGTVCLGTRQGLLVVHPDGHLLARLGEEDGLSSANVHAVLPLSPSDIWVATATGISHVNVIGKDTFCLMHFGVLDGLCLDGRELHPLKMALEDSTGLIRVGFQGGTFVFSPERLLASPRYVFFHVPHGYVTPSHRFAWYWWLLPVIVAVAFVWWLVRRGRSAGPVVSAESSEESAEPSEVSATATAPSETVIQEILQSCQPSADTPSDDERFLRRLQQIVEEHLGDEDFSVQVLASEMAMDRTVLFRRMQMLTGTAPSAYIRSVRMNVAAHLLRESRLSVSDIALQTGFATTKYFSRIFKETYGKLPKEYRNSPNTGS